MYPAELIDDRTAIYCNNITKKSEKAKKCVCFRIKKTSVTVAFYLQMPKKLLYYDNRARRSVR